MTMLGASVVTLPFAETILSTRISPVAARTETTNRKTRKPIARDNAGTGLAMIAADGLSNSRTASGMGSDAAEHRRPWTVTIWASGKRRTRRDMCSSLGIYVAGLLQPQVTIDRA